jgi:pyridoxal 5'-phosphate synthase pdxT subunit
MPRVGVLALQGDVAEHMRAVEEAGGQAAPVRLAGDLEEIDGLVIPGGESTALWWLAAAFEVLEPLRKLIGEGLPVFGTCAGMIMLAARIEDDAIGQEPFGGIDMTVRRNAFGRQVDSFEGRVVLRTPELGPAPMTGVFIRAPQVVAVGAEVTVLAEVGGRPAAVEQGSAMAVSFHPELTGDRRLYRRFLDKAAAWP